MSTLTPNFNLSKPEPTDPFGYNSFLPLFNENMDIIDENLGGGGGGGGGNVDDVEVNGVSVLDPVTKIAEITSYEEVTQAEYNALPDDKLSNGIAYFIKDSVNGADGFPPLIYSLEERQVGVWADGKPLYQKTWDLGSDVLISNYQWTNTSIRVSDFNFEKIIGVSGLNSGGTHFGFIASNRDQTYVQILQTRNSSITIRYLTLQYTKTTDVAGSGDWTPSGALAVHYSADEQVIGTWLGKTLYQRVFDLGSDVQIAYNSLTATSIDASQMQILVDAWGLYSTGETKYSLMANKANNVIRLQTNRNNANATIRYVILQYTKTTDV